MGVKIKDNLKMIIRLYGVYGKMDLVWFLRDTKYCLLYVFADAICALASIAGVMLLSVQFDGFGGMSQEEIFFLLSYGTFVDGIFNLFFAGENMGNISRIIGRGQLDHWMVQPVPIFAQVLTEGFSPVSGSSKLICGAVLTFISVGKLSIFVSPVWILGFLAGTFASAAVIQSVIYMISCMAFVAPSAAEEIASRGHGLFDMLKNYPLGGLSSFWKTIFCTIAPVGLASWLPSLALLGKAEGRFGPFPVVTIIAAALFVAAASILFRKGMKYYEKYSCPRYSGFGHR